LEIIVILQKIDLKIIYNIYTIYKRKMSLTNINSKTKPQVIAIARKLDGQRRFAWFQYYNEANAYVINNYQQVQTITRVVENDNIPISVMTELTDLLAETKKKIECPICLEDIHPKMPTPQEAEQLGLPEGEDPKVLKISQCGHKYCNACWETLNNSTKTCAICRRKWK
tara:strand:+ start:778 stop:1284 length:507 start_codon:yes stop_codon:yes gene_type:complete